LPIPYIGHLAPRAPCSVHDMRGQRSATAECGLRLGRGVSARLTLTDAALHNMAKRRPWRCGTVAGPNGRQVGSIGLSYHRSEQT